MSRPVPVVALTLLSALVACQTLLIFHDDDATDAGVDAGNPEAPIAVEAAPLDVSVRCDPACKQPQDGPCKTGSECRSGVCTGAKCVGGLVLYYPFDETADATTIVDWSPSQLNGVRQLGVLGVPGRAGTAMDTRGPGTLGYVQVARDPRLNPPKMTISVWTTWMPAVGTDPAWGALLVRSSNDNWNDGYGIAMTRDAGALYAWAGSDKPTDTPVPFPAGPTFRHVVVTWDGTTLTLYLDGGRAFTQARSDAGFQLDTELFIGTGHGYFYPWLGAIDELRLFDRVLGENEITQLYVDP